MAIEIQDVSRLPKDFCVFFCWQDHLDKKVHRFLIRDALNVAIGRVQNELPEDADCVLRQDSDTMDRAGTVEIANTILQKINSSTVIVGDVTPVFADGTSRFYPNPNVMLELGYAAKTIGWNRIICLYNGANYQAEQLPFDIRHRTVTSYRCEDVSKTKQAAKDLEGILSISLRAILQDIGRGRFDPSLGDVALKHGRDVRLLRELLTTIHRPTLDRFIDGGLECRLHDDCNFFWIGYEAVVCSSQFRFYDKELELRAVELHKVWRVVVQLASRAFGPGIRPNIFVLRPGHLWDENYEKTVDSLMAAFRELRVVLNAFLDRVHDQYSEIDMEETDKLAWTDNLPFIEESRS